MRRTISLVMLLVITAGGAPATGRPDPTQPSALFGFGPYTASIETSYALACSERDVQTSFGAAVTETEHGEFGSLSHGSGGRSGARVRVLDEEAELVPGEPYSGSGDWVSEGTIEPGHTFRMVLGAWGGSLSCSMELNGEPAELLTADSLTGIALNVDTFPTVGAVSASGTGSVAGARYERTSRGYMFMFLTARGGAATVQSPEGRVFARAGVVFDPWVAFVGPTNGTWRYNVPAALDLKLTIIEMPA